VVLIDEIDKADTDMPNGLLESFGNNGFQVPCARTFVRRKAEHVAPLLMITTNEERELPVAFVRRCIVLHMKLPDSDAELTDFLVQRGRDHCSHGFRTRRSTAKRPGSFTRTAARPTKRTAPFCPVRQNTWICCTPSAACTPAMRANRRQRSRSS
jgi:hypothetical protein